MGAIEVIRETRKVIADVPLAIRDDTLGSTGTKTVTATIIGLHPLMRVCVCLYFRPVTNGGAVPTTSAWQMQAGAVDDGGQMRVLETIFAARAAPDAWELETGVDALVLTCALTMPTANTGTWRLRVLAGPSALICPDVLEQFYGALQVSAPPEPVRIKAS